MMITTPQVLIIEDHEVVTVSVKLAITEHLKSAIVRHTNHFAGALKLFGKSDHYDMIILDIDIPGGESDQMIGMLREKQPGVRILVFSGKDEQKYAIRFLRAGANGFLSKGSPLSELGTAIRMIMAGRKYMSPEIQQIIAEQYFFGTPSISDPRQTLSPREKEVLELLLQGKLSKDIARMLNMQVSTVGTHKVRILQKMGVTNMLELFRKINMD